VSVFKRADKRSPYYQYEFQIEGIPFRGSTKRTTEREALQVERDKRLEAQQFIEAERARLAAPDTVDDVFARYWTAHGRKLSWADTVEKHMAGMLDALGPNTPFAEVGNREVAAMLEAYEASTERPNRGGKSVRSGTPSPSTVNRRLAVLQSIYTMARDTWELPVKVIVWKKHRRKEPKARVRHISTEKAKEFLGYLEDHIMLFAAWSFATGCRRNESETLEWSRVNFETRQAEVLTKGGGTRFVDLGPDALAVLALCDRNRRYVFDTTNLRRHWDAACKKAGLEDFRIHDMRHCYATWIGNKGVAIDVIQGLLGHSDIRVTTKYRRVIRAEMQRAVQALPTLIEGNVAPLKKVDGE